MSTWWEVGQLGAAHHEAGHAVVGWSLGIGIRSLEVTSGAGFTEVKRDYIRGPEDHDGARSGLVFLAAGRAAEERYAREVLGWSASRIERVADAGAEGDQMFARELLRDCPGLDVSPMWAAQQAEAAVDRLWSRIQEVAGRLDQQAPTFTGKRRLAGRAAR